MKKLLIYPVIAASLICSTLLTAVTTHAMSGNLGDGWTMDEYAGSSKSPILSGTIGSTCSNITVTIGRDRTDLYLNQNTYSFRSATGEVSYSSFGPSSTWSLDLGARNFGLENNLYTVRVKCDDVIGTSPYTYQLSDIFEDVVYIYPQSCIDTTTDCIPIYRFYNIKEGSHFYTASIPEKHTLYSMTYLYRYEGIAGFASNSAYTGGLAIHRFYNKQTGTHFYTSNQVEASRVNDTMYNTYRYEGITFYADAEQYYDSIAMHRFYKFNKGTHFYTSSQAEASNVNSILYQSYKYESAPFYVILNI